MILDNTLVMSDSQPITATAGSTNVIDLGAAGTAYGASAAIPFDMGKGGEIFITTHVMEAFNNLTSLTISLEVDDNAAFSSPAVVGVGPAILLASLGLGARPAFPARLPEGTNERYVRLKYTVAGTAPTLGKITSAIVAARQTN